jgi:cytochrome c-type biogenesis protein CcmH
MSSATSPLLFWLIAAAMLGVALAFVLPRLLARRPPPRGDALAAATNAAILGNDLAELDRELAEGALSAEDYRRARLDLERRLLDEDAGDGPAAAARPAPKIAVVIAIALPVAALGLYGLYGDPAALTAPTAGVTAASGAPEAAVSASREALVRHLAANARDARGWVVLARLDFDADRYRDAAIAYGKALEASPKVARDPQVWCEYADALGMAQGGALAGKPREMIAQALLLAPDHPKALEMAGSAAYEARDYATAARYWRQLLAQLPAGSPEREELAAAVERAEQKSRSPGPLGNNEGK